MREPDRGGLIDLDLMVHRCIHTNDHDERFAYDPPFFFFLVLRFFDFFFLGGGGTPAMFV